MSDIFISYKREDQPIARKLADALEREGWTVWWDPKLRAGERFNDVIEKALKESKCVVVMWSKRSVESLYVKDEATYALNRNKLVPVMIEEVELPFRFEGLHTPSLLGWDGSKDFSEFRRLVEDISSILDPPAIDSRKAAPPGQGETEPVVFETTRELALTDIKLEKIVALDPQADLFSDKSSLAILEGCPSEFVFLARTPVAHEFYIQHDQIFGTPGISSLNLRCEINRRAKPSWEPPRIEWLISTPDKELLLKPSKIYYSRADPKWRRYICQPARMAHV
jgi:TIR domain